MIGKPKLSFFNAGVAVAMLLSIFISSLFAGRTVLAQAADQWCKDNPAAAESSYCKSIPSNPRNYPLELTMRITQIAIYAAGALAVVFIVIGGFRYVLSQGNSEQTSAAKNTILYAVVGLVVAIFAQILVSFIISSIK